MLANAASALSIRSFVCIWNIRNIKNYIYRFFKIPEKRELTKIVAYSFFEILVH